MINFTGVDPFGGAPLPLECRRPGLKGVDTKNQKKSCSYDSSSVCAVGWVRAEWIQIPSSWRFVVSFSKSAGRGRKFGNMVGGGGFSNQVYVSVGAGTDLEIFFDVQM